MDKIDIANTLRCLQMWADHNEGMAGIDVVPPAPAWKALSKEQREDVINLNSRFYEDDEPVYWDGDTTADWVANELKKLGIDSGYNSERTEMFNQKINESIEDKILYIIRGVPGSGKSTLANKLTDNVVEADQFMYEDGEYKWKPEKLHMAHQKCKETVEQYMREGRDKIAVANTFIKLKDIKPYVNLAKQYDYKIIVKECNGEFQNVHKVPDETVERMRSKFQPYIEESVEDKITFEPTDDIFEIGGKEFHDEGCNVYYIVINNTKVGMLALNKMINGNMEIAGLKFKEPYKNKGYGKQVVKMLKEKYGKLYVRSIPDAKGFWDKQGHKSYWNKDSGTFDGMLDESVENKILAYHGSQHKNFNYDKDRVLYLTTNKEKAISYAKREWDEGLVEGELPVVFTFEVNVKNPYECHTEDEFQEEFCDYNMNEEGGREELINQGYDSIKYEDLIGLFSSSQFKLVDKEILPPSLDYYYPNDKKYGDEDINDYYYDEKEQNMLTESVFYNDLAYNDFAEKYEQLTVILNPSIEWLRNQLNSDDCWGFRFLHNTEKNKLYVWDCHQSWMHQQVFDMVDMDWGKPGTNVVGIFEPDNVAIWEELAEDGEASSSIRLAKKLDGNFFKQLYPEGYQITICC